MPEVLVCDPVGEAFAADTDALKHTVAGQLMHHQGCIDHTRGLGLVGHNATDKVRVSGVQGPHQVVQLLPVAR